MKDTSPQTSQDKYPELEVPDLRLRAPPQTVRRLSRKSFAILGIIASVSVGAALVLALQEMKPRFKSTADSYSTTVRPPAERLSRLPKNYAEIPVLGPPLPGDLGAPILEAQRAGVPVTPPHIGYPQDPAPNGAASQAIEQERQRAQQRREQAHSSQLFLAAKGITASSAEGTSDDLSAPQRPQSTPKTDQASAASHTLKSGSVIPAALITGVHSDLPGAITAQVTQNVYDSQNGQNLLIPHGARLLGHYSNSLLAGQSRLLIIWQKLVLPDGRILSLLDQPATDPQGYAGARDTVDNHWPMVLNAAAVSALLSLGAELATDDQDEIVEALMTGTQRTITATGQRITDQQLSRPPTLTLRPGLPVRVLITEDIVFQP